MSAVPSHAPSRLRARAIRLAVVSAVVIPLLAPLTGASAWASSPVAPWPVLTGQDTVLTTDALSTLAPISVAPVATPTSVVAAATPVLLAPRVVRRPAPRHRIGRSTFGQRVILEARKHFGARYRWGATGPYAFDCSGFTGYVFRKMGVRLPRVAQDQYYAVRHVSHAAARVGDLIFRYGRGGYIGHVGIYAGRGRMIDAPHSGAVVRMERIRGRYKVGRVR